jgi:hypothetical protein
MASFCDTTSDTLRFEDLPAAIDATVDAAATGGATFAALLAPSNNSGVLGAGLVHLEDGTVTVDIHAAGLTPDEVHPQHIHGFPDGSPSQPPTIALDADRDGFVETPEGEQAIGSVLLSLTASGTPAGDAASTDFPAVGPDGRLDFHQTYTFDLGNPEQAAIYGSLTDHLDGRALELHGLAVPAGEGAGTPNEVNGTDGYVAELPVAGGILHEVPNDAGFSFDDLVALNARLADLNILG